MKKRTGFFVTMTVGFTAVMCSSCSNNSANIEGKFACEAGKTIYLEKLSGKGEIVDSVKLNSSGEFDLIYKFGKDTDPQFFNLRVNQSVITLLVEPGENLDVNALCNIARTYTVEGSEGSALVRDLNLSTAETSSRIDSLYNLYSKSDNDSTKTSILHEISKNYIDQKRKNINFIVMNTGSLASVAALYQRMTNGMVIFGDEKDFGYFKLVADSLSAKYPNSVHVKSLLKDVEHFENRRNMENMLANTLSSGTMLNSPDIVMNDMFGTQKRLSDERGKVVLVMFWNNDVQNLPLINSELIETYNKYKGSGFEVYQVSLDDAKPRWIKTVTDQQLPWISVNDFKGLSSPVVSSYNVTQLPTNYILSRDGDIVGKNVWGADLESRIESML